MTSSSRARGCGCAMLAMLSVLVLLSPSTAMAQRADDLLASGASALTAAHMGTWIGAIAGGAILGGATGRDGLAIFVGAVAGGLEGAAFGAIGGALLARERWRDVWPRTHDR